MTKTKHQRDVTRALKLAKTIKLWYSGGAPYTFVEKPVNDLLRILTDMDARTGRRDPSKRTPTRKKR